VVDLTDCWYHTWGVVYVFLTPEKRQHQEKQELYVIRGPELAVLLHTQVESDCLSKEVARVSQFNPSSLR